MKKFAGRLTVAALVALAFTSGSHITAQQGGEPSRQDRIREHNERIKKIIEESQRRRDEQQKALQGQQPPAAPGSPTPTPAPGAPGAPVAPAAPGVPPTAARPGQPLPTGPVQNAMQTPQAQKPGATPAAGQAPQSARSESRTILMFHPIDSIVAVGERFRTHLVAETKEGQIDEVSIFLRYPRHILSPLALDHGALDPFVKDSLEYEFNAEDGTIYLHAKLKEPQRFAQKAMVSIIWEALEPTDGAVISYEFGESKTSALMLKGTNILGTLPGAEDGVIKHMVQIKAPETETTISQLPDKGFLIGGAPEAPAGSEADGQMKLVLQQEKKSVKAGEIFDVDVILENPTESLVDRVRLYLQFNPQALEVVDHDAGNLVTRGVNIYDAKARDKFPFDYHRFNLADNSKGTIVYEVSASNSQVRGDGRLATIRFKALQEVPRTQLVLVQNAEGLVPTTEVSYLGQSRLATKPVEEARSLDGVAFNVNGRVPPTDSPAADGSINPFQSELAQRMRNNGN